MGAGCVVSWSPAVGSVYALWQSKDILFRLTGILKVGMQVNGCLSLCIGHMMDWPPVQSVPGILPYDSWDRLQLCEPCASLVDSYEMLITLMIVLLL